MARLLILANDETTIYNFRREIIKAFVQAGHQVYLSYPTGTHTQELEQLGCSVLPAAVERHGTSVLRDGKYLLSCIKLIRKLQPDVVLTYTVKPNIYGSIACRITGKPYINNITGLGSILQNGGMMAKLICFLQKIAFKKSSCVFFQNADNYRQLLDRKVVRKNTPVTVLPGSGVNLSLHSYEDYPSQDDALKFIFVSRVRADKGFDEFFQMAQVIQEKYPFTQFHIVGWYEDDHYEKIITRLQNAGVVVYHGMKDPAQVHALLKQSHCLIHPSYHEGMANAILEASATGRPVLASNIPGCMEGFEEGVTGFGFEVQNTQSLVAAVEKFIQTPYEKKQDMGKRARQKMEREFDRTFVAQTYLKQIKELEGKYIVVREDKE